MTSELTVIIPVLRRPWRIREIYKSIRDSAHNAYIFFMCSPADEESWSEAVELSWDDKLYVYMMDDNYEGRGDYARKVNRAANVSWTDHLFIGADDLNFHAGWYEAALDVLHSDDTVGVVGTNDLGNPAVVRGEQSTHSLVTRSYLINYGTIDESSKLLHEGYPHCFVDNEFIETAQFRGKYKAASKSVVEHLHPVWGKSPQDSVYQTSLDSMDPGRQLYNERKHLWGQ